MILQDDIAARINADFGTDTHKAIAMLNEAACKVEDLKAARILRCIIFLSNGSLTALAKYIQAAMLDPRDIMLLAEYTISDEGIDYKRLRDFDKSFEEND